MENLPAFGGKDELEDYVSARCPRCHVSEVWVCKCCGKWHFRSVPHPPGQDGYRTPLPAGFKPFQRKPIRESAFGPQSELPKRELPVQTAKPKPVSVPKREAKRDGMLF